METMSDAPVTASIGAEGLVTRIDSFGHAIMADEPSGVGGTNEGPDPFALLYASLSACVLMTLRLYASRKGWPLEGAELSLTPNRKQASPVESIHLDLKLIGDDLTDDQRSRLMDIAARCPVHRTLEKPVEISIGAA